MFKTNSNLPQFLLLLLLLITLTSLPLTQSTSPTTSNYQTQTGTSLVSFPHANTNEKETNRSWYNDVIVNVTFATPFNTTTGSTSKHKKLNMPSVFTTPHQRSHRKNNNNSPFYEQGQTTERGRERGIQLDPPMFILSSTLIRVTCDYFTVLISLEFTNLHNDDNNWDRESWFSVNEVYIDYYAFQYSPASLPNVEAEDEDEDRIKTQHGSLSLSPQTTTSNGRPSFVTLSFDGVFGEIPIVFGQIRLLPTTTSSIDSDVDDDSNDDKNKFKYKSYLSVISEIKLDYVTFSYLCTEKEKVDNEDEDGRVINVNVDCVWSDRLFLDYVVFASNSTSTNMSSKTGNETERDTDTDVAETELPFYYLQNLPQTIPPSTLSTQSPSTSTKSKTQYNSELITFPPSTNFVTTALPGIITTIYLPSFTANTNVNVNVNNNEDLLRVYAVSTSSPSLSSSYTDNDTDTDTDDNERDRFYLNLYSPSQPNINTNTNNTNNNKLLGMKVSILTWNSTSPAPSPAPSPVPVPDDDGVDCVVFCLHGLCTEVKLKLTQSDDDDSYSDSDSDINGWNDHHHHPRKKGICICDEGWVGQGCNKCALNNYGSSCSSCAGIVNVTVIVNSTIPVLIPSPGNNTNSNSSSVPIVIEKQIQVERPCNNNGLCSSGINGTGTCTCNSTTGYTGVECNECDVLNGWYGDPFKGQACDECPYYDGDVCGGLNRGFCISVLDNSTTRNPTSLSLSSVTITNFTTNNSHSATSTSTSNSNSTSTSQCECINNYTSSDCSTCISGHGGSNCTVECVGLCSGNGFCNVTTTGNVTTESESESISFNEHEHEPVQVVCECDENFTASDCSQCLPNHYGSLCLHCKDDLEVCGIPGGTCDDGREGTGACTCLPGYMTLVLLLPTRNSSGNSTSTNTSTNTSTSTDNDKHQMCNTCIESYYAHTVKVGDNLETTCLPCPGVLKLNTEVEVTNGKQDKGSSLSSSSTSSQACSGHAILQKPNDSGLDDTSLESSSSYCPNGFCQCTSGFYGVECELVNGPSLGPNWREWLFIGCLGVFVLFFVSSLVYILLQVVQNRRRKSLYINNSNNTSHSLLTKRLLTLNPELSHNQTDYFLSMSSDASDWLIDFLELQIGSCIGSGSSAKVFKGSLGGMNVAVKRLHTVKQFDDGEVESFFSKEAGLIARLHHPFIVRFYGVCYHDTNYYIITEYCQENLGQALKRIKASGSLPGDVALKLAWQIAKGMEYLHSKSIIHRDLKPENILLTSSGDCKICDFGLSRLTSLDSDSADANEMTMQVGTPAYMSPEMSGFNNDNDDDDDDDDGSGNGGNGSAGEDGEGNIYKIGFPVDVYSYGILLWTLYTQKLPYSELKLKNAYHLISKVSKGHRPPLPLEMPVNVQTLMQRCWDGSPMNRPGFSEVCGVLDLEGSRSGRGSSSSGCGKSKSVGGSTNVKDVRDGGGGKRLSPLGSPNSKGKARDIESDGTGGMIRGKEEEEEDEDELANLLLKSEGSSS